MLTGSHLHVRVKDWRADLGRVLHEYDEVRLQQKQSELAAWYRNFVPMLRHQLVHAVIHTMAR